MKAAKGNIKFEKHCARNHSKTPIRKIDIAKVMRNAVKKRLERAKNENL